MAMARDGLLPQYFAKVHPRFRPPHITTIWTGVVVGVVAIITNIGDLADLTNIGTLFAFILVCLGVNVLRRVAPDLPRPFRVPFVPVFPILGVILCVVLMLSLPVMTWIRFVVWLGIGLTIYFLYSVRHSKLRRGLDAGITEDVPPPLIKTSKQRKPPARRGGREPCATSLLPPRDLRRLLRGKITRLYLLAAPD